MQIPRIAIFEPNTSTRAQYAQLFSPQRYSLRRITSHSDAVELVIDETQDFDVLIIPAILANGLTALSSIVQCKAENLLKDTPLLILTETNTSLQTIVTMYEAGADFVMPITTDAEILYLQICALGRTKKIADTKISQQISNATLQHPILQSFDSLRDGLLLFDATSKLIFSNLAAKRMLGSRNNTDTNIAEATITQFLPWIREHLAELQLESTEAPAKYVSNFDVELTRIDGQPIPALIMISSISQGDSLPLGQVVFIVDLGEIQHLGNLLLQAQRTRSLCLLASSACQQLIADMLGTVPLAPYKAIQDYLSTRTKACQLEQVLADLLETLDLLINPNVSIKVYQTDAFYLVMASSDLFVMLGHLILHAVEFAGVRGDVSIHCSSLDLDKYCALVITSESRRQGGISAHDRIGRLIQHDLESLSSFEDLTDKTSMGLHVAQNIAQTYGTNIDFQNTNNATIRLRVKLPVLSK